MLDLRKETEQTGQSPARSVWYLRHGRRLRAIHMSYWDIGFALFIIAIIYGAYRASH